jgi:CRISPR-associated Csx11 family protein
LFNNYVNGSIYIDSLRKSLTNILKINFSHALGETRIPSNDITLWDHSYSTASLFKPILAGMTCGKYQNNSDIQWRIFGISWNGIEFINQGRKIADIKTRSKIIEDIKANLKGKFECEIPIGNVIYEDINGIYFTFPNLDNDSENLAIECSQIALEDIRKESDYELWPFFLLSDSTKTLTIITNLLNHASKKRTIPKMSPILFVEDKKKNSWEEKIIENQFDLDELRVKKIDEIKENKTDAKIDVCPVCGQRPKTSEMERCKVCEDRRMGRLGDWLISPEKTIWTTEVADKNNRVALLSFSFYLDNWLNGTMIGTIFSQTYNDWFCSNRSKNFFKNKQNINKLKKYKIDINDTLFNLSKNLLKIITDGNITKDAGFKSSLINTFYEDIQ